MDKHTTPGKTHITPDQLMGAAGDRVSLSNTVNAGNIASQLPELSNPMELLVKRAKQERASMIGALAGAYLTMTGLDPGEVEFVQAPKVDGSIGFRFRPREPQDKLWTIWAEHRDDDGTVSFEPLCFMPPGTSEQAAHAFAAELYSQTAWARHPAALAVKECPLKGFIEDLGR